eukprot:12912856-Prorocentrum_lima.AAC.1
MALEEAKDYDACTTTSPSGVLHFSNTAGSKGSKLVAVAVSVLERRSGELEIRARVIELKGFFQR